MTSIYILDFQPTLKNLLNSTKQKYCLYKFLYRSIISVYSDRRILERFVLEALYTVNEIVNKAMRKTVNPHVNKIRNDTPDQPSALVLIFIYN